MEPTARQVLPDHAAEADHRALAIDQVGICGLSYPIAVWDKSHKRQATVAKIALSVALPSNFKGTHMSRFIEVLNERRGEMSLHTVPDMLAEVQRRLHAHKAFIEVTFPYFLERSAPVSGARSLMEYTCAFIAEREGDRTDFVLKVTVPVKTLCPCSKAVSRYGAHNQRGLVTVEARFDEMLWIEDVVEAVESCASSPLYALLKREDEKYVTEKAYENPRFVEDLVRDVVLAMVALGGVRWLRVSAENIESIHNHSAWAQLTWPSADADPVAAPMRPEATPPSFGSWLRGCREQRKQSQRELAEAIGLSASALSRVERDDKCLSEAALGRLAKVWGMDPLKLQLRAGVLPSAVVAAIQRDPEGLLRWMDS